MIDAREPQILVTAGPAAPRAAARWAVVGIDLAAGDAIEQILELFV